MKKGLTEFVFVLDRSGSMFPIGEDFVNGFNTLIELQAEASEEGEALVTTVLFNTKYSFIHDRLPVQKVEALTFDEFHPCGVTALLDATGQAIDRVQIIQKHIREEDAPERTLFVICTDGQENASGLFTLDEIREMIKSRRSDGWDFLFFGAEECTPATAESLGIDRKCSMRWTPDKEGILQMFAAIDRACNAVRRGKNPDIGLM